MSEPYIDPTRMNADGSFRNALVRSRLQSFGLTMIVMGVCFIFYYLGLFGTVEGPLAPAKIGATLSSLGVTQRHVIVILLSVLVGAISWNWVYNLTSLLAGHRMTCTAQPKGAGDVCGAPVKRTRHISRRTGRKVVIYVCAGGHRRPDAHFHPLKKGTVSNTIWLACLIFVIIAVFGA